MNQLKNIFDKKGSLTIESRILYAYAMHLSRVDELPPALVEHFWNNNESRKQIIELYQLYDVEMIEAHPHSFFSTHSKKEDSTYIDWDNLDEALEVILKSALSEQAKTNQAMERKMAASFKTTAAAFHLTAPKKDVICIQAIRFVFQLHFNLPYLLFFCSFLFLISSCKNFQKAQKTPTTSTVILPSSNVQQLKDGKTVEYMTKQTGQILILKDELEPFFEELGDLELEIRLMKNLEASDRAANIQQFKDRMAASVQEWKAEELMFVKEIFEEAYTLCSQINPELFPAKLQLILTDGSEENNAFYTRDAAIIIPHPNLQRMNTEKGRERFLQTMIHEVFHVYSRLHPDKQRQLYETIGYEKIETLNIGSMLQKCKLTNPDGVDYHYKINVVKPDGDAVPTILMIYSKHPEFTPENGNFFQYLDYDLFEIEQIKGGWQVVNGDEPTPLEIQKVSGFREQIGNNTDYIIHPDEVLADNVAILVMEKKTGKLPSRVDENGKKLLERIEDILKEK